MVAGDIVGAVVVVAVVGFLAFNFTKTRRMSLAELLAFAIKARATELKLEVGEPIVLGTPAGDRNVLGPVLKAADYERLILGRLDALRRQELKAAGRLEWSFEEKGIGKIEAHVEPSKARLVVPRVEK